MLVWRIQVRGSLLHTHNNYELSTNLNNKTQESGFTCHVLVLPYPLLLIEKNKTKLIHEQQLEQHNLYTSYITLTTLNQD